MVTSSVYSVSRSASGDRKKTYRFADYALRDTRYAASLAFFRIVFGLLMLGSLLRFMAMGWVETLYVSPGFFFTYYGFEWVKPLPEWGMWAAFITLAIFSFLIVVGLFYRIAITGFFLLFTYVELIDKALYLNHYYFVSLAAFLMIFLPMHRAYSVDAARKGWRDYQAPLWMKWALMLQVGTVYFFGGVAKIKPDWLLDAQPLRIWLSNSTDVPLVGGLLDELWVAYTISWLAMLFDLLAPFLLLSRKTRPWIYLIIIIFHLLTWKLFYIGMFPWIMMACALIFFPSSLHERVVMGVLSFLERFQIRRLFLRKIRFYPTETTDLRAGIGWPLALVLVPFFVFQFLMPFRYLAYPGELCWTEQGFRYAWNIMLIEKNGYAEFQVRDAKTGKEWLVLPREHLTPLQEKMMSTQPDMVLQFVHYLHQLYKREGKEVEIRAEVWASLNGKGSRLLIDPNVNLVDEKDGFENKPWILPLEANAGW